MCSSDLTRESLCTVLTHLHALFLAQQTVIERGIYCLAERAIKRLLGASAYSIGRPYLYGLATGGESGVAKAIDILASETRRCMLLAGYDSIRALRSTPPLRRVGQT